MKIFNTLIILAYSFITVNAQVPNWDWAKSAGGSTGDDRSQSITTDINGNVYITGGFNELSLTFGSYTLINTDSMGYDIFIVKYDAMGNVLWAKSEGGSGGSDIGLGITTDAFGNVYVTGWYTGTITLGATTLPNFAGNNIFIAKYDNSGNALWAVGAGGLTPAGGNNSGQSIFCDAFNNLYVTGAFTGTVTFGSFTLTNVYLSDRPDVFIVKYDASGNALWAKSAGGNYPDLGKSITTDASGNIYITGWFSSPSITFGTTTLTNASGSFSDEIFITKYDSSGNVLWAKREGGMQVDRGHSITTDALGNVYVCGIFTSPSINFGTTTLTLADTTVFYNDLYFVKYDALGNVLWAKGAGSMSADEGVGITTDASGNVYLTGWFASPFITFGTDTLTNTGSASLFIVKYDTSGNFNWAKNTGGDGGGMVESIAIDAFDNVYVTGWYIPTTVTFGSTTLTNTSLFAKNIFIAKLNPTIVGTEVEKLNSEVRIYPNPTNDEINIDQGQWIIKSISIHNLLGETVYNNFQFKIDNAHASMDISHLPSGVYFVRFTGDKEVQTLKVVKQ
jgi:hypothetical protein